MDFENDDQKRYVPIGGEHQVTIPQLESSAKHIHVEDNRAGQSMSSWPDEDAPCTRSSVNDIARLASSTSCCVLHGCELVHWTELEEDSFLLGLYIFKKDFEKLRQFVGTKEIRHLQDYYYGRFWGSKKHESWSDLGKERKLGNNMFNCSKRLQLVSRLIQIPIAERQISPPQLVRDLSNQGGDSKLYNFFFALKDLCGLEKLVKTVDVVIGQGRQGLTISNNLGSDVVGSAQSVSAAFVTVQKPKPSKTVRRSARLGYMSDERKSAGTSEAYFLSSEPSGPAAFAVNEQVEPIGGTIIEDLSREMMDANVTCASEMHEASITEKDEKNDQEMTQSISIMQEEIDQDLTQPRDTNQAAVATIMPCLIGSLVERSPDQILSITPGTVQDPAAARTIIRRTCRRRCMSEKGAFSAIIEACFVPCAAKKDDKVTAATTTDVHSLQESVKANVVHPAPASTARAISIAEKEEQNQELTELSRMQEKNDHEAEPEETEQEAVLNILAASGRKSNRSRLLTAKALSATAERREKETKEIRPAKRARPSEKKSKTSHKRTTREDSDEFATAIVVPFADIK